MNANLIFFTAENDTNEPSTSAFIPKNAEKEPQNPIDNINEDEKGKMTGIFNAAVNCFQLL